MANSLNWKSLPTFRTLNIGEIRRSKLTLSALEKNKNNSPKLKSRTSASLTTWIPGSCEYYYFLTNLTTDQLQALLQGLSH